MLQNKFELINQKEQIILEEKTRKHKSTTTSNLSPTTLPIIYVTENITENKLLESTVNTDSKGQFIEGFEDEINDSLPLFFRATNLIFIPKTVKRNLERNVPKEYLKKIDNDPKIAVEKCLVFISNLSSTIYDENRWKKLNSSVLHEQTKKGNDNTFIYPYTIKALKYNSNDTCGIIRVKKNEYERETYQEGVESKSYSLTDTYFNTGLVKYMIKDSGILQNRNKFFYSQLNKAYENIIAKNLIHLYKSIELPTIKEIHQEAKRLVKDKYKSKKGKTLTFLKKHSKSYYSNNNDRTFVESNIKLFEYYTSQGFMIPNVGSKKSGGRVVDSFTLMPSWIRKLIKIDGEPIVEVDFKALHPNIAMTIYGGSKRYLTHDMVAEESNIDLKDVKIQHLSYFNETVPGMKYSPLFKYYSENEPVLNNKIMLEKMTNVNKHKITSMRMFAFEVAIMTECIRQLNSIGIYVGYVYDALFCKESDVEQVKKIMNQVVLQFNVYTIAC